MGIKVITPRAADLITLAQLRLHGKLDNTADDTLLAIWLEAAYALVEHRTGRSIGVQTLELALDEFPSGPIQLPQGPVTAITSLKYQNTSAVETTLSSSLYTLDDYSDPQWLVPAIDTTWPATLACVNAVKLRYVAGAATLPWAAFAAILLLVGHANANREAVMIKDHSAELPLGVQSYLDTIWDASGGV